MSWRSSRTDPEQLERGGAAQKSQNFPPTTTPRKKAAVRAKHTKKKDGESLFQEEHTGDDDMGNDKEKLLHNQAAGLFRLTSARQFSPSVLFFDF
jgi:hypothetical protein